MEKELLLDKIDKVVDKLIHLGGTEPEESKGLSVEEIMAAGKCDRDFGIEEWDWPQGVGLYGLYQLQSFYGDKRYEEFIRNWIENNLKIGLPSRNINTTAPFLSICSLLDDMPQYEKMCEDQADWLMNGLPKTKDGGFQHVTSAIGDRNSVMLNNSQIWADTLFMAVLFLNRMGIRCGREDWKAEAVHQFLVHIKYLYDKKTGLLYHGWSFERNDNFGGIYWCRGDSWFTYGMMAFLADRGDDIDAGVKQYFIDTYKTHVEALKACQAPSGLWHTVLLDPTSYEEVSGSAAIAAGMLIGVKSGLLDESYRETALKAVMAICDNVAEDGTVLNVSSGTAMGMDADHYKNIIIHPMAYGQSLTLLALIEALDA
ncbi:MAG: glycoside hydrolase family 88 protein [Lachnospiraceae bacterium]|jgi:unsaturated rhamnogalacturonyl hydrolase|nr:glycoside hydrolase family 88 protein [Lachnospiraceae bacterium]MCH4029898.1 glycoside hydrolase family 88 protein [Lachnospiraceae bacterium]MCH4109415.1 glycoside hydrolase family 88 protein [Lachnospiraceae bacterium]MCI1303037.1 glycoside hydrolase family 88 protein [Lachnospiraceae bacterium]MCI1332373.1 glycoside hydrolase family 88 protein [Lachnospiraceae bacterium]